MSVKIPEIGLKRWIAKEASKRENHDDNTLEKDKGHALTLIVARLCTAYTFYFIISTTLFDGLMFAYKGKTLKV